MIFQLVNKQISARNIVQELIKIRQIQYGNLIIFINNWNRLQSESNRQMTFRDRRGTLVLEGQGTNFKDKLLFFEGVNLVGRNPAKTNVTIKDRSISQIHAKIICKDHTIKIVDAKSKNGVYLNNLQNPIEPDAEIQINPKEDIVYFAQIKCRFQPDWIAKENDQDTKQFTVKTFKPSTKTNQEVNVGVGVQTNNAKPQQKEKVVLNQNKNSKKDVETKQKSEKNQQSLKANNKQTKKQQQLQKIAKQKQKDELLKAIQAEQQTLNENSVASKRNNQKIHNQKSKQSNNDEKTQGQQSKQLKKKGKKQSKEKQIKNTQKQKITKEKQKEQSKQNVIAKDKGETNKRDKNKQKEVSIKAEKQEDKDKDKQEIKKQKNKQKVSKKTLKEQENQKKEGKAEKSVDTKQKESKQLQKKIQNQIKQQKQKLSKLQKRGDSNQTKVKGKNKRITKSAGKIDQTQQNNKKFPNKKKIPETLNSSFSSHPKRSIVTKTVLLSCYKPAFTPFSRIVLIENWRQSFDVLVMQKFSRTFKLLYSICLGIPVVSNNWINQCQYRRGIASFQRFYLQSPQKDLIQNSIAKVKSGNKVFDKLKFYLIQPQSGFHLPLEQIEALVDAGGGTIIKKLGKKDDIKQIIFIMKLQYGDDDIKALKKIQGAEKIYTIQMIMDSCLRQQIKWSENTVSKL